MTNTDDPMENECKVLRSTPDEGRTNDEAQAMKRAEQSWDNEGGHMSSTSGRVMHVASANLPYVVSLSHHGSGTTQRGFATMRDAEAYIKRNTPVPGAVLSTTYDQPALEPMAARIKAECFMNDDDILARLKVIDRRLKQISTEAAASVLAGGLANAGLNENERLRLVAETERILDELDGHDHD